MLLKDKFLGLLLILLVSCDKVKVIENHGFSLKDNYVEKSFPIYSIVYKMASDSLGKWCDDSLAVTSSIINNPYRIDSIFIFNSDSTCFLTTVNKRKLNFKNAIADLIMDFAGKKINGKWYFFFMGVSEPVLRSYWQDSVYVPLTFEELSCVAYQGRFKGVVEEIMDGHPEKVDEYFARIFTELPACNSYSSDRKTYCQDSIIIASVSEKYKNKLTQLEIAEIQSEMSKSEIPKNEPLIKKRSLWDKLQYGEKVFESEEWKDYLKQKYGNKWQEHL